MPDQTINCPKCGTQIPITEALTGQIEQNIKLRYESEAAVKAKEIDEEKRILKQKAEEIEAKGQALDEQVDKQLKAERNKIAEQESAITAVREDFTNLKKEITSNFDADGKIKKPDAPKSRSLKG